MSIKSEMRVLEERTLSVMRWIQAFVLETPHGERHRFESRERHVHALVERAWAQRISTTVIVRANRPDHPFEIRLHGAPPALGH